MVTAEAVRAIGGFEALTDSQLEELIGEAQTIVEADVARMGLSTDSLDRLVTLKACELAQRLMRTPDSESAGGLSASYVKLDWRHEYARELNRLAMAEGARPARGVM